MSANQPRKSSRQPARLVMATILSLSLPLLAGCGGPTRSVAAYCSYFYGEGGQLRDRWIQAASASQQNPMAGLASVFSALPEAASFLHELSLRAPETIAPDVQILAQALKRESEQMGGAATDPLGALAGGLVDGLATSGPEQRVNEYTKQHCGTPPGVTSQP